MNAVHMDRCPSKCPKCGGAGLGWHQKKWFGPYYREGNGADVRGTLHYSCPVCHFEVSTPTLDERNPFVDAPK